MKTLVNFLRTYSDSLLPWVDDFFYPFAIFFKKIYEFFQNISASEIAITILMFTTLTSIALLILREEVRRIYFKEAK